MADTKISDLPVDATTLAGGDKFPVAKASSLSSDAFATADEIKTFVNNAPVFAAGSATAGSKPKFTSGTDLTTTETGAFEFSDERLLFTQSSGQRGKIQTKQFVVATSDRNLTNSATIQNLFASPQTITLTTGAYLMEGIINLAGMSATTGNAMFTINNGGTATLANILVHYCGIDGTGGAASQTGSWSTANASATNMVSASTNTNLFANIKGYFTVTGAGTVIPAITLVTASAAVLKACSFIQFERLGAATVLSVGNWA